MPQLPQAIIPQALVLISFFSEYLRDKFSMLVNLQQHKNNKRQEIGSLWQFVDIFILTCYLEDSVSLEVLHTLKILFSSTILQKNWNIKEDKFKFLTRKVAHKSKNQEGDCNLGIHDCSLCLLMVNWKQTLLSPDPHGTADTAAGFALQAQVHTDGIALAPAFCHNQK